jgi:RNA-binding protein
MKPVQLTPLEHKALRARAHFLDPVVMIGDAGLTDGVLREVERNLLAHELIKVRVAGETREGRDALLAKVCEVTGALPIQHIGKLLILFRAADKSTAPPAPATRPTRKTAAQGAAKGARRNPVSGRTMAPRPGQILPSTRKTPQGLRPPRTARVRKSGQRSAKKPFQDS